MANILAEDHENVFLGTVEGYPGYDEVLARLNESGVKKARLIPFMVVAGESSPSEADDREEVVRASGYASYTFECDWTAFTLDDHIRLALLMEDVLDEITQIKADAEARVLTMSPLWPLVEIRSITV